MVEQDGQVRMEIRTDLEPGRVVLLFDKPVKAVQLAPHDAVGIAMSLVSAATFVKTGEITLVEIEDHIETTH